MKGFKGNLSDYRLSLLTPALASVPQLGGTLKIERGSIIRQFSFELGLLVRAHSNDPSDHLSQALVELNALTASEAARLHQAARANGRVYGEYLVKSGGVSPSKVIESLKLKAEEAFKDCYLWQSGDFEYLPVAEPRLKEIPLQLSLNDLHAQGMRHLADQRSRIDPTGENKNLRSLVELAKDLFADHHFEAAADLASQALEHSPVPEAQTLYREAEYEFTQRIPHQLKSLEGQICFEPIPVPAPPQLTADDFYLYTQLKGAPTLCEGINQSAMGSFPAWRGLKRLIRAGLVRRFEPSAGAQTHPFGVRALA